MSTVLVFLACLLVLAVLVGLIVVMVRAGRRPPPPAWQVEQGLASVRPEVVRLLHARQVIQAVKVVRSATSLPLEQAKAAVDAIAHQEGIDPRRRRR